MKRIEFIAPVESMRGNLSGEQDLRYALNNNKAFEAPDGRQYARNYQPRYVGSKRSKDGMKYFAVRTKSATELTEFTRLNMALLGGSQALYAHYIKIAAVKAKLTATWLAAMVRGDIDKDTSLQKWFTAIIREMLKEKEGTKDIGSGESLVAINNPWITPAAHDFVKPDILKRFWMQLSGGGVYTIKGKRGKGYFYPGIDASDIVANYPELNTFGLASIDVEGTDYIGLSDGSGYLCRGSLQDPTYQAGNQAFLPLEYFINPNAPA